jgi:hypothetical protein
MAADDYRGKIVTIIKSKGPVLPVQITKELNTTPIFAAAMLSELVDAKILRLSSTKIGGSPVYYLPGQESLLPNLLYGQLHEKEKKAFDMLKSKGIQRDRTLEPVIRVALRQIKDFAIPLEVTKGNDFEIFWKFFSMSDSDAEKKIREILTAESMEKKTSTNQKKSKKKPQKAKKGKKNSKNHSKKKSKSFSAKKSTKKPKKRQKSIKKHSKKKQSLRKKKARK